MRESPPTPNFHKVHIYIPDLANYPNVDTETLDFLYSVLVRGALFAHFGQDLVGSDISDEEFHREIADRIAKQGEGAVHTECIEHRDEDELVVRMTLPNGRTLEQHITYYFTPGQ